MEVLPGCVQRLEDVDRNAHVYGRERFIVRIQFVLAEYHQRIGLHGNKSSTSHSSPILSSLFHGIMPVSHANLDLHGWFCCRQNRTSRRIQHLIRIDWMYRIRHAHRLAKSPRPTPEHSSAQLEFILVSPTQSLGSETTSKEYTNEEFPLAQLLHGEISMVSCRRIFIVVKMLHGIDWDIQLYLDI